ncbi:MAG TPA: HEAT repeat domain-containing protein [Pirellulales bacterium]|nr:HEAT repeat domain-containing protein [Pirellulales bacterium]
MKRRTASLLLLPIVAMAIPALAAANPDDTSYQGIGLAEWKTRVQPRFSVAERRQAIAALQGIGIRWTRSHRTDKESRVRWLSDEIVPPLVTAMKDPDASLRRQAIISSNWIDKQATTSLIPRYIELLGDSDDRVRGAAAGALTFRGSAAEPAIPKLLERVREDKSAQARREAAIALRTAGPKAVAALFALVDDKNTDVRRAVLATFQGSYMGADPTTTPLYAVSKFKSLLNDANPQIRTDAAMGLIGLGSGIPANVGRKLLENQDPGVRHASAEALLTRNNATAFQVELLKLMGSDEEFRRANANLLSRLGTEAIPMLLKLLDDRDPNVRGNAAESLGHLGHAAKEAVDPLKKLQTDMAEIRGSESGERVCHRAGQALRQITGDEAYIKGLPPLRPDGL